MNLNVTQDTSVTPREELRPHRMMKSNTDGGSSDSRDRGNQSLLGLR